jgi:capsular exopolysaccharide synthesis family protein
VGLRDYLTVLRRRWALIAGVTALTGALALAATLLVPAEYTATATLRLQPNSALIGGAVRADDLAYLDRLQNTYADLAKSRGILDEVVRRVNLETRPSELQRQDVEVEPVPNTELIDVRVTTATPASASRAADELADVLVTRARTFSLASYEEAETLFNQRAAQLEDEIALAEQRRADLEALAPRAQRRLAILKLGEEITSKRASLATLRANHQVQQLARQARAGALSVVSEATEPSGPSNRRVPLALALGLALGLIAAVGLAFLSESLTRRFRSSDEIEEAVNTPILATIPRVREAVANPSFDHGSRAQDASKPFAAAVGGGTRDQTRQVTGSIFNSGSRAEEAFRRLAMACLAAAEEQSFKTVLVTSAEAGEGKTTVVTNLGRTLAQSGRAVLLVDANLRSPAVHEAFGIANGHGLSDVLAPSPHEIVVPFPLPLRTALPGLSLVPAGEATRDPSMLLGSPRMKNWVESLAAGYDFVLFDSPAVLAVSDALTLARAVDAVLLVTRANVHRTRLESAHRALQTLKIRFLGVVVNATGRRDRPEPLEEMPSPTRDFAE